MFQVANHLGRTEPAGPDAPLDWMGGVVTYLQSRGLAARKNDGEFLRKLLELPVRPPPARISVARMARTLNMSRRTLGRRCLRAGLPSPRQVLCFGRVLRTLQVMREMGRSMDRATRVTGWSDPFQFSNATRRLTGMRPTLAQEKDLVVVAEAWLQRELAVGNVVLRDPEPPPCPSCGRELESQAYRSLVPPSIS